MQKRPQKSRSQIQKSRLPWIFHGRHPRQIHPNLPWVQRISSPRQTNFRTMLTNRLPWNRLPWTLRTGLRPKFKGGPKPSSRPFFREGFQIQFSPFGKFRTGRAIFFRPTPKCFADRFTEVGVGVKWLGGGRLGKMAARSDAARQTPPGHPGLQHTSVRPPSDAIPPRYCRDSALPPYFRSTPSRNE